MRLPWSDYQALKKSGLFDEKYYLREYPDCRQADVDPIAHYLKFGYKEGRNPSASFNTTFYLQTHPDVQRSDINPLLHYIKYGRNEGRQIIPQVEPAAAVPGQVNGIAQLDGKDGASAQGNLAELASQDHRGVSASSHTSLDLVYGIDTRIPKSLVVGKGTYLLIKGWCFSPQQRITGISLKFAGKTFEVHNRSIYRDDVLASYVNMYRNPEAILHSGFWGLVQFDTTDTGKNHDIELSASLASGKEITHSIGEITLLETGSSPITPLIGFDPSQPKIAICMATYNPPMDLFEAQVKSIESQSFTNWVCIISDDHTRADIYERMCAVIANDKRFVMQRNEDRLGHYHNFEAALYRVPKEVDFIAFADQDDEWYPDKLARCLAEFKSDQDQLVYSDMDILSPKGEKLSSTYWVNRENNYTSLQTLLYANTVTGAACMFRASLLADILPFPEKIGDVYHDHWAACVAFAHGRIKYIDEPLYAYKQHGANAYGLQGKIPPYTLFPEFEQYIKQLNHFQTLKHEVKVTLDNLEGSYNFYLLDWILETKTLLLRVKSIPRDRARTIRQLSVADRKISGLLAHSARYLLKKGPSLGYELLALRSYVGHHLRNRVFRYYRQTRINQVRRASSSQTVLTSLPPTNTDVGRAGEMGNEDSLVRQLKIMTSPLSLDIATEYPKRVNLLLATVDFNYIFGGYLAMFNLAKKIGQYGNKARIVIVEPCDYKPNEWRKKILAYPGLEDLFDYVETSYNFDRNFPLPVNPDDNFIATSCWTAHIASRTARTLNGKKIIFFAQEYEPIFFPMGSLQAISNQSYFLPQYTIFSTELLRQYFRNRHIGVYKNSPDEGDASSMVINNAINPFEISLQDIGERKKKKFLFYARPEAHAARNLYELGLLGLENAIHQGVFSEEWEFYGIGTIGNNRILPLGNGRQMTLLPKVSLKEYLELIPTFDLGMSLMLSPHPSLVPLEMAAAGMPVITNTYENKTVPELTSISTNLIGIEPTVEGIAQGLQQGVKKVPDFQARMQGARINWPTSWNQVFDDEFKAKLFEMLRSC